MLLRNINYHQHQIQIKDIQLHLAKLRREHLLEDHHLEEAVVIKVAPSAQDILVDLQDLAIQVVLLDLVILANLTVVVVILVAP